MPCARGYRPDLDGLRAVAVIAVLAYHAFPQLVRSGFVGVDIFFVISGYLITAIIQREMLEKRFKLSNFYARRILRIFPALIVVVLATFVLGWFVLSVSGMEALGTNIEGAAAFIENLVLHEQVVDYFNPGAERLPLLHLWSLGIEEQYYIVWPAALWLISHWQARRVTLVAALALGSFLVCVLTPPLDFSLGVLFADDERVGASRRCSARAAAKPTLEGRRSCVRRVARIYRIDRRRRRILGAQRPHALAGLPHLNSRAIGNSLDRDVGNAHSSSYIICPPYGLHRSYQLPAISLAFSVDRIRQAERWRSRVRAGDVRAPCPQLPACRVDILFCRATSQVWQIRDRFEGYATCCCDGRNLVDRNSRCRYARSAGAISAGNPRIHALGQRNLAVLATR